MAAETEHAEVKATIRAFRSADAAAVTAIAAQTPEAANWTENSYREALNWPGVLALVCEDDGKVAGFLLGRLVGDDAEILNLAITRTRRRRGEGTGLLNAAMGKFRARGVSRVFLEVRESNDAGIAFYEKQGFRKKGRRSGYYHNPDEAAALMEMKLGD